MNVNHKGHRRAISQSMDLFIIIAAVLTAGGVVFASLSGLVGSASKSSNLQVTGTLVGNPTGNNPSLAVTIKNVGTQNIASGTLTVSLSALGYASCAGTGTGSGLTWTVSCTTTTTPITATTTASLNSGSQVALAITFTGGTTTITSGTGFSLTVTLGSSVGSAGITAQ